MELFELYQKEILSELEVGKLLQLGIEEISKDNISEIEKQGLLPEDKIEVIKDRVETDDDEELLSLAQNYLNEIQKEPREILTDDEGEFAGCRFQVNEKIGSVTYHDVHVRLSDRADTIYFGSLWYTDRKGNTRRFNYEVTNVGNINYTKRIGRRYYRQVLDLTEKVISWFEDKVKDLDIEIENSEELDVKEALKHVKSM